ncbi:MAG: RecQ family ATP-dependent DNA helicase [Pirellulales bacterium]
MMVSVKQGPSSQKAGSRERWKTERQTHGNDSSKSVSERGDSSSLNNKVLDLNQDQGNLEIDSSTLEQWTQKLKSQFGLDQFRPGQIDVIRHLMEGRSAAAVFPTGGGKSLCYQFPASVLDGLTVVVSPLLALMREQVDYLNGLGLQAFRLDSTLTAHEVVTAQQAVKSGKAKLLYVAPERFFNERFRELIEGVRIALFAVDEAHCISQWGHSFRPDYLKLAQIAKQLQAERILALTATATPTVLEDMCQQFGIDPSCAVRTPFYRSNLKLTVSVCNAKTRMQQLVKRLQDRAARPAIVYVTLQKTAEEVAEQLVAQGLPAKAYHAGLDDEDRTSIQDWFMNSPDGIVTATIAFGMGIDKSNIRSVFHYNPSKSLESYAQEIGRAGRDGLESCCHTLLVPEDRVVLENFAYGDTPSRDAVQNFTRVIAGQPNEFFISYYQLAYDTDIRDGVIRSLMTNLELQDYLQSTSPRYELYKFKPKVTSSQILKRFEGERKQFASSVLSMAVKKKVFCEIDVTHSAARLKCDRTRIVRMLEYFSQNEWIELEASSLAFGYRKLKPLGNVDALAEQLFAYLQNREASELQRLDQIFDLMASSTCQTQILSQHFGQTLASNCGNCSSCNGQSLGNLPAANFPRVGDSARSAVTKLAKQHPELLSDSRSKARFLCGLSSPKFIRARLTRDSSFGCCSEIPFAQVMSAL